MKHDWLEELDADSVSSDPSSNESATPRETATQNRNDNPEYLGVFRAMEQVILHQPLQFHGAEYNIHPDHDCLDHYTGHTHHFQPPGTDPVEQYRRESTLPHPTASSYGLAAPGHASGVSAGAERWAGASDASSYQTAHLAHSSSASFSTSPSSAASSSHPYTTFQPNAYTTLPAYTGAVTLPQAFVQSSFPGARISEPATAAPSLLTPLARPPLSTDAPHRDAYAAPSTPYLTQLPQPFYATYHDTPRSYVSALPNGLSYASTMTSSSNGYGQSGSAGECLNFPWPDLECLLDLTCEGQAVTPNIHAKVEKGFFLSDTDDKWTCYRRNYFSVQCHFDLTPTIVNGRLFVKRNNNASEQVQAMGMRLAAAVDGSSGKSIELIQHTPKRDAGPKTKIEVVKVAPTAGPRAEHSLSPNGVYKVPMDVFHATGVGQGPFLPLQNTNDNGSSTTTASQTPTITTYASSSYSTATHAVLPGQHTTHTFERVQFKSATANNGKRRASQQYFHLIVELFVDVRKTGSETPVWVKVAQRVSDKIVVRGRSPSHYQNEGQYGSAGRSSGSSGSSYGAGYGTGAYGSNTGGFRSAAGLGGLGGSGSGCGYRGGNMYCMQPSSEGSRGDSSPGSVDEGTVEHNEPLVGIDAPMTGATAERHSGGPGGIQDYDGYRYYPSTIYESVQLPLPPLGKPEGAGTNGSGSKYTTDRRQYGVRPEYADAASGAQWAVAASCGRFEGVPSSHGFFPDLSTGFS